MRQKLMRPDVVASMLGVAVSAVFFDAAGNLPSFAVKMAGPEFFPRASAVLLAVLCLVQAAVSLTNRAGDTLQGTGGDAGDDTRLAFTVMGLSVAYFYGMTLLGFMLGTFLYSTALTLITQEKRDLKRAVGSALVIVAAVYVVFAHFLQATLPSGRLFG
ncbi:MAG: tripartite tricarboxylate transporter TctB family protein [Ignavibacteriales bacterium]